MESVPDKCHSSVNLHSRGMEVDGDEFLDAAKDMELYILAMPRSLRVVITLKLS